jgi:hypothetical protein
MLSAFIARYSSTRQVARQQGTIYRTRILTEDHALQDRPTAAELLDTVAAYLETELMPALDGPLAYRTRVAANLVRILERETALGPDSLKREHELLCGLLGDAAHQSPAVVTADAVAELNRRLVAAIDAGAVAHADAWPALLEIAHAKLAIIRPSYDVWDEG